MPTTTEASPSDFMDLKEIGTSSLTRTVVTPLGDQIKPEFDDLLANPQPIETGHEDLRRQGNSIL